MDFEASHQFVFSVSLFTSCEPVKSGIVISINEETHLISIELVLFPIFVKITQEAYHSPSFSSYIISFLQLSEEFEFSMYSSLRSYQDFNLFKRLTCQSRASSEVSSVKCTVQSFYCV